MKKRWVLEVGIEPRDLWVGLFWDSKASAQEEIVWLDGVPTNCYPMMWHLYFCFFPCVVVHIYQELVKIVNASETYRAMPRCSDCGWYHSEGVSCTKI